MDLIDTLEALITEETSALERADLTTLTEQILPRKAPLLKALNARRTEWEPRRRQDPHFERRLQLMRERQESNVEKLRALRFGNRKELAELAHSAHKATGVRRAYGTTPPVTADSQASFTA